MIVGSRKSAAMGTFTKSIEAIYNTPAHDESAHNTSTHDNSQSLFSKTIDSQPAGHPYMVNSVFTMPSLFAKIDKHDGNFLLMYDEMSLLFKNIDRDSKDSPMRQIFLSLANGDAITRTTSTAGEEIIPTTNVNFCGKSSLTLNQIMQLADHLKPTLKILNWLVFRNLTLI